MNLPKLLWGPVLEMSQALRPGPKVPPALEPHIPTTLEREELTQFLKGILQSETSVHRTP